MLLTCLLGTLPRIQGSREALADSGSPDIIWIRCHLGLCKEAIRSPECAVSSSPLTLALLLSEQLSSMISLPADTVEVSKMFPSLARVSVFGEIPAFPLPAGLTGAEAVSRTTPFRFVPPAAAALFLRAAQYIDLKSGKYQHHVYNPGENSESCALLSRCNLCMRMGLTSCFACGRGTPHGGTLLRRILFAATMWILAVIVIIHHSRQCL